MKNILLPIGLLCSVALCFGLIHIGNMKAKTTPVNKSILQHEATVKVVESEICHYLYEK